MWLKYRNSDKLVIGTYIEKPEVEPDYSIAYISDMYLEIENDFNIFIDEVSDSMEVLAHHGYRKNIGQ